MNLLQRSIELRDSRTRRPDPTIEEMKEFIKSCFLEYHGICGIAIDGGDALYKNLTLIAEAEVRKERYILTVYRNRKPYSITTNNRKTFVDNLVEGMSHHL